MKHYHIAFVGLGSIGQRHFNNVCQLLTSRGCSFSIDLYRNDLAKRLPKEITERVDRQYLYSEQLKKELSGISVEESAGQETPHHVVEIPVCYGGSYGEDLKDVAAHAGLTEEEVIKLHSSVDYNIYMLGFLPGFPYLGGLDPKLFTPRLDNPRTKIPEGSVGIGGEQTGIYPLESPGGWRLIGRTPLKLYDPDREQPFLYQAGDYIRFVPITAEEYEAYL